MLLRNSVPASWQTRGRAAYVALGKRTPRRRVRPDFILIGAQRCGTTSLFRAMNQHPNIVRPSFHKGVNYFDVNYDEGPAWYAGHFPTISAVKRQTPPAQPYAVFEASGYYMFHPLAIRRIATDLPEVKLVAMVRDPVERAYSAWKHESARGFETEDFATALVAEDSRLEGEIERMTFDPRYQSYSHRHHAYRRRGEYVDQFEDLVAQVDRTALHVMYSESFFGEPQSEFGALCSFLDLPMVDNITFDQHNARPSTSNA